MNKKLQDTRSKYQVTMKQIIVSLLLIIAPFFLTGCSLRSTATKATNQPTLTIWRQPIDEKVDTPAFSALITGYKKAHPSVIINYRIFKPDEDYETAVLNGLAAGTGPDIWEIRNDELPRQISKLTGLSNINQQQFASAYAHSISQEMFANGKLYGLPLGIDPLVLFINTDHFKKLGNNAKTPTTWDDAAQLGKALTAKAGSTILRPGLALGAVSNVDRASETIQLLMLQFKTQMTDPAHRTATFDLYTQNTHDQTFSYPGKQALQLYAQFGTPGSEWQTWDSSQPYSTQAFAGGFVSMMIDYYSVAGQIRKIAPKLPFSIGPVPQLTEITVPMGDKPGTVSDPVYTAKYRALVVSKPSVKLTKKQQDAQAALAWQFLQYAAGPAPTAAYAKSVGLVWPYTVSNNQQQADAVATVINPYIVTWHKGKNPRTVDNVITQMAQAIIEQGADIDNTFHTASTAVTQLLR